VEAARERSSYNWVDFAPARPVSLPTVPDVIGAGFTHAEEGHYPVRGTGAFEAGGPADVMPPCSVLAELTGQALDAGMDRLSDDELVGVLRAARRLASWQSAIELAAVEELAARRGAETHDAGPRPAERASAELAAALTLTSRSADVLLDLASGVARLPGVAAALTRGEIDLAKAAVFAEELSAVGWLPASVIASRHVLTAPALTTSQLRSVLRRAVLAADPQAGRRRQHQARQDARVQAWEEASGNGALAGRELPAGRVLQADRHVSALARSMQAAGMPGTLDQVRAEVFLALLSGQTPSFALAAQVSDRGGATDRGADGDSGGPAAATVHAEKTIGPSTGHAVQAVGRAFSFEWPAGPLGSLHLTMPFSSWLDLTDGPGHVAGHGPADAWTCRELAEGMIGQAGTRYCLTVTTPEGHPVGHACTRIPPPRPEASGPVPPGPTPPAPRGRPRLPSATRAWLAGLTIEWLQGGTCSHSRETSAYRPGRLLDHLIKVRNPTCTAPGCRRPAQRCDVDHVIPYHLGGKTCECNCHPLCRRHHRCKGGAGWLLEMPEPGVLAWKLPHGRTYLTRAEPCPV
jgi:hypothetical protein